MQLLLLLFCVVLLSGRLVSICGPRCRVHSHLHHIRYSSLGSGRRVHASVVQSWMGHTQDFSSRDLNQVPFVTESQERFVSNELKSRVLNINIL